MTSYEFEKAAKNAVIKVLNENINISELDLVWFAHELGYKKCTIWGQPMGNKYAEVTYNRDKDEMYVDIYQKIITTKNSRYVRLQHSKMFFPLSKHTPFHFHI